MSKVISFESKLIEKSNIKEIEHTQNIANESKIYTEKTIVLNNEEIITLIEVLTEHLEDMPNRIDEALDFIEKSRVLIDSIFTDGDVKFTEDDIIEENKKIASWIFESIEKLTYKLLHEIEILNKEIKLTNDDAYIYYDILSDYIDYYVGFNEINDSLYFKEDYNLAEKKEKILKYLYKQFRDLYIETNSQIIHLNEYNTEEEMLFDLIKKEKEEYENILNYYSSSYIKKYKSKTIEIDISEISKRLLSVSDLLKDIYLIYCKNEYLGDIVKVYKDNLEEILKSINKK